MTKQNWTFNNIPDLSGKTIIVTGGNSGLGFESVKAFALKGGEVILACRTIEKGENAKAEIMKLAPKGSIDVMKVDLADLTSVRVFAEAFKQKYSRLDVLLNNAGIMGSPDSKTKDGFEAQFGTNHLGHFALTGLLLERIKSTPNSRVVNVASLAHRQGVIDFDDLMYEHGRVYKAFKAYGQSKLANLLFTYELQRFFERNNINSIAVAAHPGGSNTRLANHLESNWFLKKIVSPIARGAMMDAAKGALSQIRAAVDPEVKGGEYYGAKGLFGEVYGFPALVQSIPASHNLDDAKKLWEVSEKLTEISYQ